MDLYKSKKNLKYYKIFKNQFVLLILTHRRADKMITLKMLERYKYGGEYYIVIDNTDSQLELYKQKYGDKVIVFDKKKVMEKTDMVDNLGIMQTITMARNVVPEIAKQLGKKYAMMLDDDFRWIEKKITTEGDYNQTGEWEAENRLLDKIIISMIKYMENAPALKSIAIAQNGDFIGGRGSDMLQKVKRKAMNTFLIRVDDPPKFIGTMNEDVNMYITEGKIGELYLTIPFAAIKHKATQSTKGGITETYKKYGTYAKSFYSVIVSPSNVKIKMMPTSNPRIHHNIQWKYTVPQIISEKYKK